MAQHPEKVLPTGVAAYHLIKLCPSMDIVAVVTKPKILEAFRFDGQRAFEWKRSGTDCAITSIAWLANGTGVSIIWDDGEMEVVDSAHANARRCVPASAFWKAADPKQVACKIKSHTWAATLIEPDLAISEHGASQRSSRAALPSGPSLADRLPPRHADAVSLEDYYERVPQRDLLSVATDLPNQLALVDVDTELPRLSVLPRVDDEALLGINSLAFTTPFGVDAGLYSSQERNPYYNIAEIMVACWDDGDITSSIDDKVDCMHNMQAPNFDRTRRSLGHASHVFASCHAMVSRSDDNHPKSVLLDLLSFNIIRQSGRFLSLIMAKTTTLMLLQRYILQCISAVRAAWKTCQDLPSRFISNINEELAKEKNPITLEAALYHQAVTGCPIPAVKEWLAEELQDRGHKRWDTAVSNGYNQIISLIHTNLLPALDRASVMTSRLRGLGRIKPPIPVFDVEIRYLTRVMSDLDNLRLIGHHVLNYANEELQTFRVFSIWLQLQITICRADTDSTTANDAAEKAAGIDYGSLLSYVDGPLTRSHLNIFLGRQSLEISEALRRPGDQLPRWLLVKILEKHDKEIMQPKSREEGGSMEAVNALWQGFMLRDSILEVIVAPARGFLKAKAVEVSSTVVLKVDDAAQGEQHDTAFADIRMVVEVPSSGLMCTYVLDVCGTESSVYLHRVLHDRYLGSLPSGYFKVHGSIENPSDLKVRPLPPLEVVLPQVSLLAIRFLTDDVILLLVDWVDSMELFAATYGAAAEMNVEVDVNHEYQCGRKWSPDWRSVKTWEVMGFVPEINTVEMRLTVNHETTSRRETGERASDRGRGVVICVVGNSGKAYRILEAEL